MSSRLPRVAPDVAALRVDLLRWYRRHRRDLPWRRTRDPWAIWVSEVMLQQTQVATVAPYYHSFLARFPDVASLARARPHDVLRAWAGLGYYRRARHLHEAARTIVREHGGRVPGDPAAFGSLPGVGRYTAGAVLSIAFGRPAAVLDGNVARVFARLFALPGPARDPQGARRLWALADSMVPMRGAGDWNQALMELGARVCTPRAPRCLECPLTRHCRARAAGRPERWPTPAPRRASQRVRRAVALVARDDRVLVTRRSGRLLAGLWEPPGVDLAAGADAGAALACELRRLGVETRLVATGERERHAITHRRIEVEVWRGRVAVAPRAAGLRVVDPRRPGVPLTGLARKLLALSGRKPRPGGE